MNKLITEIMHHDKELISSRKICGNCKSRNIYHLKREDCFYCRECGEKSK